MVTSFLDRQLVYKNGLFIPYNLFLLLRSYYRFISNILLLNLFLIVKLALY